MLSSIAGTSKGRSPNIRQKAINKVKKKVKQVSTRRRSSLITPRSISTESYDPKYSARLRQIIRINVSGAIYETFEKTLDKYPETILGTKEKRKKLFNEQRNEIFLNKSRNMFDAILFYYQSSGLLIRPCNIDMNDFVEECYYYGISWKAIKLMKQKEHWLFKQRRNISDNIGNCRINCWTFLEKPKNFSYPYFSLFYWFISYMLTITSIILMLIETRIILNKTNITHKHVENIERIEALLNLYFTVEITARFLFNPWPKRFLMTPLNACEIISFSASLIGFLSSTSERIIFLRIGRILRGLRLLRISRCSTLIKTACSVVQRSFHEVVAVTFIISIITVFAGSIMYFIEMEEIDTKFKSIPDSMWWAIQTVLCVGYGDITPTSVIGKSVGGVILYLGVLTTTVMLLSLGGRIFDMYLKELTNSDLDMVTSHEGGHREDYEIKYKDD